MKCHCGVNFEVDLPFIIKPELISFNYSAFFSGIFFCDVTVKKMLLMNYYDTVSAPAVYSINHPIAFVPAFGVEHASALGISTGETLSIRSRSDVFQCIKWAADSRKYIRFVGDEYYIYGTKSYKNIHYTHDNLIVGYCPKCQSCAAAGYRNSPNGINQFGITLCRWEDVANSITSYVNDRPAYLQDVVYCLTPNRDDKICVKYDFVKENLESYNNSVPPALKSSVTLLPKQTYLIQGQYPESVIYGRNAFLKVGDMEYSEKGIDPRAISVMVEHKNCMLYRVRELIAHVGHPKTSAIEDFEKIAALAKQIKLRFLRDKIYKPSPIKKNFFHRDIEQMIAIEQQAIVRLLDIL